MMLIRCGGLLLH